MNGYDNGFENKTSFGSGGGVREIRERYGAKKKRRARFPRITADAVFAALIACEIIFGVIFYDAAADFLYTNIVEPAAVAGSKILLAAAGTGIAGIFLKTKKPGRKFF